jgi:Tim17/Tim22/Tim23/Pmp24 family
MITLMRLAIIAQGLALGGVWGLREGFGRPLATQSSRLRLNAILNAVTRRGSWMGNSAGVLGLSSSHCPPQLLIIY